MNEIKLNNGQNARPYFFRVMGYRMTIWARNQKEAIKRADKLWGQGKAIPEFGPGYP